MSQAPRHATVSMLVQNPAHFIAFGAGSGLSPKAPGTVGTLWGWASFVVIQHGLGDEDGRDAVILKPFTREALAVKVRQVLDAAE